MGNPYDPTQSGNPQQYPGGQQWPQNPAQNVPGQQAGHPQQGWPAQGAAQPQPNWPGQGGPYPSPTPPSGGGSKKLLWLGGGVAALVVVAIIALVLALTTSGDDNDSGKPAPVAAAKDLVLSESGFPSSVGGEFSTSDGNDDDDDDDVTIDNDACNSIVNAESEGNREKASRELTISRSGTGSFSEPSYEAEVTKPVDGSELDDFDDIVSKCSDFTMTINNDGTPVTATMTMSTFSVPGITGTYKAATMTGAFEMSGVKVNLIMHVVLGIERQVGIEITHSLVSTGAESASGVESDLASMFNQQRELIANAS